MCYLIKTNFFCKQCLAVLPILAAAFTTSCSDQDFDFDKMHSQNVEANYTLRFEELYGSIDPNQSWDLSYWGRHSVANTRAGEVDETTMVPIPVTDLPAGVKREWNEMDANHYAVKYITSHSGNNDWASLGGKFVLQAPYCGFSVSVMSYHINSGNTGVNFQNVELHMCVQKDDTQYYDYTIWNDKNLTSDPDVYYKNGNSWTPMPKVTSGGGTKTTGIKSNSFVFGTQNEASAVVPPGTTIWFYTLYVGGRNDGEANLSQGNIGNTTSSKGTMVAFKLNEGSTDPNVDQNNPIYEEKDSEGNIIKQGILIGSELDRHAAGGGNYNYNDLVFLIEGLPLVPQREDITDGGEETEVKRTTKRYMVEDMGYSDPSSEAVNLGYTDIDFNDIVVDFSKVRTIKKIWKTSTTSPIPSYETISDETSNEAKVLALGGTWDFKLYVGENEVFHKHLASQVRKSDNVIDGTDRAPGKVDFNPNYKIGNTPISLLYSGIMYNTDRSSELNGDGNYNTDSYICELTATGIQGWDIDANNIKFVIYDSGDYDSYYSSENEVTNGDSDPEYSDEKNVYNFGFPSAGATPKIIAFDPTKVWQREKVHVTTDWFNKK